MRLFYEILKRAFHRALTYRAATLAGLMTIAVLLVLILTKRASPLVALIRVPVAAALLTGAGR